MKEGESRKVKEGESRNKLEERETWKKEYRKGKEERGVERGIEIGLKQLDSCSLDLVDEKKGREALQNC